MMQSKVVYISEAHISDTDQSIKKDIPVIGITGGVGSGKSVVMKVLEEDFHGALILADLVGHDLMEPGGESYKKILEHFGERILEDTVELPTAKGSETAEENQRNSSDKDSGTAGENQRASSAKGSGGAGENLKASSAKISGGAGENQRSPSAKGSGAEGKMRRIDRKKLGAIVFSDDSELQILNRISHGAIREEILRRIKAYRQKGDHPFIALEAALLIEGGYEDITDQLWYIYVKPEERIRRLMKDRGYTEEKCRQIMSRQLPEEDFLAHADVVIDNNGSIEDIRGQIEKALQQLTDYVSSCLQDS